MEKVLVEDRADGVTVITINRPEKRNAICSVTAVELQQALQNFDDSDQRVAVITGAGDNAFSAGADVNDIPEFWRCVPTLGTSTNKPLIAAVGGFCIGGGFMISVMCDMVIASSTAKFSYPEARLGLTQGGMAALAARIPHKVAMEIMLLGKVVPAQRAYEVGMVNEVVPEGQQLTRALEVAQELAQMAPMVLAMLKDSVVNHILPLSPTELTGRYRRSAEKVAKSADCAEGFASFREKRKPVFTGN